MRRRLVVVVALVALVALVACKKSDREEVATPTTSTPTPGTAGVLPGAPVARGSLHRDGGAGFSIIASAGTDLAALAARARREVGAAGLAPADVTIDTVPATARDWSLERDVIAATEVGPAVRIWLDAAIGAVRLLALSESGRAVETLRRLGTAAIATAGPTGGWILNAQTARLHAPGELAKHLPAADALDVREVITLHHVDDENGLPYIDTMGMSQLGLPELIVKNVPRSYVRHIAGVVNATAQTLALKRDVPRAGEIDVDLSALGPTWGADEAIASGGTGKITWHARWTDDADHATRGDPTSYVIELVAPGTKAGDAGALISLMDTYSGKGESFVQDIPADDPELTAAGERARKELGGLRSQFAKGIPMGEHLVVKAPFEAADGQVEWMWVEVTRWKGDKLEGILDNDPVHVTTLHAGQQVTIELGRVADYLHVLRDGSTKGGYSVEILQRRYGTPGVPD